MLDDVVIVPVEMSNNDLVFIVETSRRLGLSRNETIRKLIRLGFESLVSGSGGTEETGKKVGGEVDEADEVDKGKVGKTDKVKKEKGGGGKK